jgi:FkbM family methyltransferase
MDSPARAFYGALALAVTLLPLVADAADILHNGTKLYSQNNEELIIRDFFQDRRDGFFLDVGCAWPKRNSTTYYLEHHLGWSGIAVDALSDYAPAWAEERPRSKFFNFLVSDHSDTLDAFHKAKWSGVSSVKKDRIIHGEKVETEEIRVPTITLTRLLESNGISRIDFLSMDIEEAEPAALAGFDIERFKPALVGIEASPSIRQRILEYFTQHGYRRLDQYLPHDSVNWYFAPRP